MHHAIMTFLSLYIHWMVPLALPGIAMFLYLEFRCLKTCGPAISAYANLLGVSYDQVTALYPAIHAEGCPYHNK